MKSKTIKQILRRKSDQWLESIEDENLRKLLAKNHFITGGCIASMLLNEKVNDFDVYFKTREAAKAAAEYYVKVFKPAKENGIPLKKFVEETSEGRIRIVIKSAGIASEDGTDKNYEYFETRADEEGSDYIAAIMQNPGEIQDAYEELEEMALNVETDPKEGKKPYRPVFLSSNAITLADHVQLVIRFYGEPSVVHENYDYVHCTNYWKAWDGELVLNPAALEALLTRELRYVGSKYPLASIIRMRKFIKRGWTINAGQILKMVMQLGEMDLNNVQVLKDQLTGVDVAYFMQLIDRIQQAKKGQDRIDTAYIIEIIDRMF